jgi:YHS domain-containing protein
MQILFALGLAIASTGSSAEAPVQQNRLQGVVCPVMGSGVNASSPAIDYNGVRYFICCAGCDGPFIQNPKQYIGSEKNKGKVLGISLYDPVSKSRLDYTKADAGFSDYNGVRYYFARAENKRTFDANPKQFGTAPAKEALYCPVMGHGIASYDKTGGYHDHEGVRYYVCCPNCLGKLAENPGAHVGKAASAVNEPKALPVKK